MRSILIFNLFGGRSGREQHLLWAWLGLGLGVFGALARAIAVPALVADVDGVNFARALERFDPLAQAPHFPGYPVYVGAATLLREAGVLSDVWALSLPCITLWPLAAVVLAVGSRVLWGSGAALGISVAASLAPGVIAVGGWPGSDGFGLALGCCALGFWGIAQASEFRRWAPHFAILSGISFALMLGVRLSWWPWLLVPAALTTARLMGFTQREASEHRRHSIHALASGGFAAGLLGWTAALFGLVDTRQFFDGLLAFSHGHATEWGGTAFTGSMSLTGRLLLLFKRIAQAAFGVSEESILPSIATVSGAIAWPLLMAALVCVSYWTLTSLWRRRYDAMTALLLSTLTYGGWVLMLQNLQKVRHTIPLVLALAALAGAAVGLVIERYPIRRQQLVFAMASVAIAMLGGLSLQAALTQGRRETPPAALAHLMTQAHSPADLCVFTGEEARVLQHHIPSYRVLRPADATALRTEAQRLSKQGVQVWVTSEAPGVGALAAQLTPLAQFDFDATIRPQDANLTLYRYAPGAP